MPFLSSTTLIASSSLVIFLGIGLSILPSYFSNLILTWRSTTYCYASITTLSPTTTPNADCITISPSGLFSKVFVDEASYDVFKAWRTGHVIPGLWDGHGHLLQYGELLHSVNLFGAQSMGEVLERVHEYRKGNERVGSREEWIRGVGWDQAMFGGNMPMAQDLENDPQLRGAYIMLDRIDVHCVWVSEAVLRLLPDPLPEVPGGEIVTDPGKGVFCDNAMDLVMEHYPKPGKEKKKQFVRSAMKDLNSLGIVGIHDAGVTPEDLNMFEEMIGEGWTVRVYGMLECKKRNTFCPNEALKITREDKMLEVRSVKLFADGALGSWGSAMIEPYSDHSWTSGSLLVNASMLTDLTHAWASAGYQVNIHAIGDLANRLAIDAISSALDLLCPGSPRQECQRLHRFRIEHAQIIHPDDQKWMYDTGIIPSIQPTHATSDMSYAETRLGTKRTSEEAYRMRSLLPLNPILGSDFPVEPADPFQGIFAAVARRSPQTGLDAHGGRDGWYMDEALTLEEALRGFTIGPAYGAFLEGKAGIIEVGAFADWIVLDEPLETMDVDGLRALRVREVWIAGKMVFERVDEEL
ncbi:hypothetical protein K432DRAFT_382766 [Lepidopterella palustris CBS 459.81]|uniref:Amidohydrolase 3 domain-containing protein n=1 Tax=Lepidopterella palustris CBS 459.81 TaxID=1314670 RepID=A0A8E2E9N1_9PEZI|nr:hypothetical protein K432DRAFT_382766 [Lepidopterella palustris CBS 459.81]